MGYTAKFRSSSILSAFWRWNFSLWPCLNHNEASSCSRFYCFYHSFFVTNFILDMLCHFHGRKSFPSCFELEIIYIPTCTCDLVWHFCSLQSTAPCKSLITKYWNDYLLHSNFTKPNPTLSKNEFINQPNPLSLLSKCTSPR